MSEFLAVAFAMPTAIFSTLLILVLLYWLVTLAGLFDFGIFEGLADAGEGLGDGLESSPGFFQGLGFGDVPRSITWSLIAVFGWLFSYFGRDWIALRWPQASQGLLVVAILGLLSLVLAGGATAFAIQPLRKLMDANLGPVRQDLVGKICTIKTLRVDERFGQAEAEDGQLIQVRVSSSDSYVAGSQVRIAQYDPAREVFLIKPLEGDG